MLGSECPVCGEFFTGRLSDHLADCGDGVTIEEPEQKECEICGESGPEVITRQARGRERLLCPDCADAERRLRGQERASEPPAHPPYAHSDESEERDVEAVAKEVLGE